MKRARVTQEEYYRGVRMIPYDLVKELAIAMAVVTVLVLLLATLLSSPDSAPVTIQQWSNSDPVDFTTTATAELAGSSTSGAYGPPYTAGGNPQSLGPISPQGFLGIRIPVDSANDYVLGPLQFASLGDTELADAIKTYKASAADQQAKWTGAYTTALGKATVKDGSVLVDSGDYGPVAVLMARELAIARTGGLDGALATSGHFYQTDFTKPLLFMGDGGYLPGLAKGQKLTGNLWGMMNEPGNYPGQSWLWLYTMWYQLPQFQPGGVFAANADLVIVVIMLTLSLLLLLVPFIPGLRDIPRWLPIYRLIWRTHYRRPSSPVRPSSAGATPGDA